MRLNSPAIWKVSFQCDSPNACGESTRDPNHFPIISFSSGACTTAPAEASGKFLSPSVARPWVVKALPFRTDFSFCLLGFSLKERRTSISRDSSLLIDAAAGPCCSVHGVRFPHLRVCSECTRLLIEPQRSQCTQVPGDTHPSWLTRWEPGTRAHWKKEQWQRGAYC